MNMICIWSSKAGVIWMWLLTEGKVGGQEGQSQPKSYISLYD
jgi:hypothetical protein